MKHLKPKKPGYYWYREGNDWDQPWDIVKIDNYSRGWEKGANGKNILPLTLRKPILMVQYFGYVALKKLKKTDGIWGERVSKIKELEEC